ncbi:hypothetical protein NLX86_32575 [Streptomyces sp. A3M-1-3]|uniref:hypothetical protein n=1 Tax=Streptomyces sp. A3M-1-3 TaxID=2962044 RepID=UPI0020B863F1|nr:hypothetical protein [Streptomyces sp. A3M-1-3]MCP3822650.1 hypothetical protein [Streptomyces sp. A3M-1-3]
MSPQLAPARATQFRIVPAIGLGDHMAVGLGCLRQLASGQRDPRLGGRLPQDLAPGRFVSVAEILGVDTEAAGQYAVARGDVRSPPSSEDTYARVNSPPAR